MRNKNAISFLLVVFSLICIFQIFMTWRTFNYEGKINNAATPEERKTYVDDKDFMDSYRNAQKYSFGLGLDLQGGMFATLEVAVDDLIKQEAGDAVDTLFTSALALAAQRKQNSQKALVDLFYEALQEKDPNIKLSSYFANADKQITFSTSNEEVLTKLRAATETAIENTYGIIRRRIDQFGVASPNIQLQAGRGRIIVELPGVKEPARVRELLRSTAKLEFWETYTFGEGFEELMKANEVVKRLKGIEIPVDSAATDSATASTAAAKPDTAVTDSSANAEPMDTSLLAALADTSVKIPCEKLAKIPDSLLTDTQQRDKFLCTYPILEEFAPSQQEEINANPATPIMGHMRIADTSKLNRWLNHPDVLAELPNEVRFAWGSKPFSGSDFLPLLALKVTPEGVAKLDGSHIESAKQDFDPTNSEPNVSLSMNIEGAKIWSDMTGANVGKSVAITMDNIVYSYPKVINKIPNGNTQISGSFTVEEAKDLATLLGSGKLPVKVRIEGEKVIGPTLGADNISKGMLSFIVAFLMVIAFMAVYYNSSGVVADVALLVNLFFIIGVSAAWNVVLTLPGIAAVVLTMGMAVDANVLVYERVREELAIGKSIKAALQAGYKNAFSSIMDSNITTFLTGVILYVFGIGPIRGFAVNLIIGIITTLICALFVTRIILEFMLDRNPGSVKFWSGWSHDIFKKISLKMTQRKRMLYIFSGALTVASFISIGTLGFKNGVEFSGGYQYTVKFAEGTDLSDLGGVRSALAASFGNTSPVVKTVGSGNQIMITTNYRLEEQNALNELQEAVITSMQKLYPDGAPTIEESMKVGAVVSNDIRRSAIISVIFAVLVIFIYILIRFRKWQYSLGAVIALVHDVIITMGIFSLLGHFEIFPFTLELDQNIIAALLTIVGYSINDTVIVFDRVRENFHEMKSADNEKVFNLSMDQTLSRTLITSGTTLFTVIAMLIFGGATIQPFMFVLFVGILFGTYSSVFIASAAAYDLLGLQKGGEAKTPVAAS